MHILSDSLSAMANKPVATVFGLVLFATSGYVSLNALFWQGTEHPSPIAYGEKPAPSIASGDAEAADRSATNIPRPPARDAIGEIVANDIVRDGTVSSLSLKELQIELTRTGYYLGPIDGLPGPMTTAALDKLEKATGLDVTAKTNAQIAALLKKLDASVIASSEPAGGLQINRINAPAAETVSYSTADRNALREASQAISPPVQRPQPEPVVQVVQQALAEMGYAPGAIDGLYGSETKAAIIEFERHRALPETGQISARLIQELEAVSGRTLTVN